MILRNGANIIERQLEWLWPGLIPIGQDTIIEGDPGTAKSTLTLALCYHVTTGKDWPDGMPCPKGHVIIANAEDPEDTIIVPRLKAAGADLDSCHILCPDDSNPADLPFIIPESVPSMQKRILEDQWPVKLIIFDPIEALLGIDNYRNQHVRKALRALELMASRLNCAIVFVRHLNKDTTKAAIYRGGGSIGMIGAARAALSVGFDPADNKRCIVVPVKQNWTKKRGGIAYRPVEEQHVSKNGELIVTSKIEWDGEVDVTADDIISAEADVTQIGKLEEAGMFLKNFLADGPKKATEIMSAASQEGIAAATVKRAAQHIAVIKHKEGYAAGGYWVWELPSKQDFDLMEKWAESIDWGQLKSD